MFAPSGEMSPQARAAAERIARLPGEDLTDEQPSGEHCPLCTLVHGVPLPEPIPEGDREAAYAVTVRSPRPCGERLDADFGWMEADSVRLI
jgi:hypothetical protein